MAKDPVGVQETMDRAWQAAGNILPIGVHLGDDEQVASAVAASVAHAKPVYLASGDRGNVLQGLADRGDDDGGVSAADASYALTVKVMGFPVIRFWRAHNSLIRGVS